MLISKIKIGKRHRRELGDIAELAASIEQVGLLHPIVIRSDGRLIAGERRLRACKSLGWARVPVTIVNIPQIVRGEFAENAYRKSFLPSEIDSIRRALEPIEKAAAKERMSNGGKGWKISSPLTTRDKIAKFAGISGRTLDKIKTVVAAAEANPRFLPLVRRMDESGHVNGAYKRLEELRSPSKSKPSGKYKNRISVEACNKAFPKYPPTIEAKGWIYGVWYCGTSWTKNHLHGQYPGNFLNRALSLFPDARDILHCPSGSILGPGITVDSVHDGIRCPQIVSDAANLPFNKSSFDLVLSDPPYTDGDAQTYGCTPFPLQKFMQEARRVLRRGGYLGILHLYYPAFRPRHWRLIALIGVITAPNRAARVFSIFERL
jgi:ParB family chromosome partitioning protein